MDKSSSEAQQPRYGVLAFSARPDLTITLVKLESNYWHDPVAGLRFHRSGVSWYLSLMDCYGRSQNRFCSLWTTWDKTVRANRDMLDSFFAHGLECDLYLPLLAEVVRHAEAAPTGKHGPLTLPPLDPDFLFDLSLDRPVQS